MYMFLTGFGLIKKSFFLNKCFRWSRGHLGGKVDPQEIYDGEI